jgi:hypothetical protein
MDSYTWIFVLVFLALLPIISLGDEIEAEAQMTTNNTDSGPKK